MTYRLWWTVGYTCSSEREFLAAKHRLLPATYEMLDDALRRASQVGRAGGVAWLIEGDDKTPTRARPDREDAEEAQPGTRSHGACRRPSERPARPRPAPRRSGAG